jgi:radical SAM-linked protein
MTRGVALPSAGEPVSPLLEARQRWRLTFARAPDPLRRTHREIADAWTEAIAATGMALPRTIARPRPPLTFAAPLPAGIECRHEYADLFLAELQPVWWVRQWLDATLPPGVRLLSLDDVWLGAPALAAAVRAADYSTELAGTPAQRDATMDAAKRFLSARRLERERTRGGGTVRYDIRALVEDIHVDDGGDTCLRIRVRFLPDRGAGRPDEVLAALEELQGEPIPTGATVRDRVLLADR